MMVSAREQQFEATFAATFRRTAIRWASVVDENQTLGDDTRLCAMGAGDS
jgi:hypothetical protein